MRLFFLILQFRCAFTTRDTNCQMLITLKPWQDLQKCPFCLWYLSIKGTKLDILEKTYGITDRTNQSHLFWKLPGSKAKWRYFQCTARACRSRKWTSTWKVTAAPTLQTAPTGTLMSKQTHSHLRKRTPDLVLFLNYKIPVQQAPVLRFLTFASCQSSLCGNKPWKFTGMEKCGGSWQRSSELRKMKRQCVTSTHPKSRLPGHVTCKSFTEHPMNWTENGTGVEQEAAVQTHV